MMWCTTLPASRHLSMAFSSISNRSFRISFGLTQATESFTFVNIDAEPVPSLLRGFSAPVVLNIDYTDDQLLHLLAHDSDAFNP